MIIFLSLSLFLRAQNDDKPFPFLEVKWSNDFVFQTDRYFSNGIHLSYFNATIGKSPTSFILIPSGDQASTWHGISMVHNFYTPDNLFDSTIIQNDRPYASYFLIGHKKISLDPTRLLKTTSHIQLGVLGEYSGGKSVQNGIHEVLPSSKPSLGWDNQLSTDFAVNYGIRFEKAVLHRNNFDLIPHLQGRAGIPYTDLGTGIYMRTGFFNDYFSQLNVSKNKGFEVYVFADVSGKWIIYNATLQGGLFNSNPHVLENINNLTGEIKSGFVLGFRNFSFEYGQVFLTPEFQFGKSHKWGYFAFRFSI